MADRRISELPAIPAVAGNDALAIVDTSLSETNKVSVEDLLRSAPAGTAAAPSIAFVDDPDTGLYRSAANELSISTAGSQRVVVDAAGQVGIGTSSPSTQLHIAGTTPLFTIEDLSGAAANTQRTCLLRNNDVFDIQLRDSSGNYTASQYRCEYDSSGSGVTRHSWYSGTTIERMRITSEGRVGIGTSSPGALLDVSGSSNSVATSLRISNTNAGITGGKNAALEFYSADPSTPAGDSVRAEIAIEGNANGGASDLILSTNGGSLDERMRITSAGRVGIGTSSPSYKLHVIGTGSDLSRVESSDNSNAFISFTGNNTTQSPQAGAITNDFIVRTAFTERMRIDSNGNVGIGTSNPGADLHVAGGGQIRVDNSALGSNVYGDILSESGTFVLRSRAGGATAGSIAFRSWDGTTDSERMRIDSAGNVGIGTNSPASKLHLADTSTIVTFEDTNSTNNSINSIGSYEGTMILNVDPDDNSTVTESLRFTMRGSEAMRIDNAGNVGIGTSVPDSAFHVYKQTNDRTARFQRISTQYIDVEQNASRNRILGTGKSFYLGSADANPLVLQTAATERMRIDSTGNVGIGTSNPGRELHVVGASNVIRAQSTGAASRIEFENLNSSSSDSVSLGSVTDDMQFVAGGTERMRIRSNGVINFANCPTYADDTAAGTGGLVAGDVYKTSTGELRIKL